MFPEVKPRGTLRVKGQKTQFPMGPHHSPLLCLTLAGKNLPWFQGAEPDHMQVRSSTCCFPTELRTFFIHPWKLVSFDPLDTTHMKYVNPPI